MLSDEEAAGEQVVEGLGRGRCFLMISEYTLTSPLLSHLSPPSITLPLPGLSLMVSSSAWADGQTAGQTGLRKP